MSRVRYSGEKMFTNKLRRILSGLIAIAVVLLAARFAWAVSAQTWDFNSESSYADGHFNNTVVNNLGELALSRELKPLLDRSIFTMISAIVAAPDGSVYFGTSPNGKIYKISNGKSSVYYQPPAGQTDILSLAIDKDGTLLAGTSGTSGQLIRLSESGGTVSATTVFQKASVQYIWAIKQSADGTIFLATGPDGQIWRIDPQGHAKEIFSADVHNIMSLAIG